MGNDTQHVSPRRDTMPTLRDDNIAEFALCDAWLLGISWLKDGEDLRFRLRLADHREAELICTWVTDLTIDLQYMPLEVGLALSLEARFTKVGTQWHLVFEFPPQGGIELICNAADLKYGNTESSG